MCGFKPHRSVHVRGIINETEREMISGIVESSVLILLLLLLFIFTQIITQGQM